MSRHDAYRPYQPQLALVEWGTDIWIVNGPVLAYALGPVRIPCPTRMTVVRFDDGTLWVHSPVSCDPALVGALSRIGPVAAIVAPNSLHSAFMNDWAEAFPEASLFAPCELAAGQAPRAARRIDAALPQAWANDLEAHVIRLGAFTEAVFFHRASRSLIVTDLMQNFEAPRVRNPLVRLVLAIGGATGPKGQPSIEIKWAARQHRAALRAGVDQMLGWNPASIILSHGQCYQHGAMDELSRAFAWLE